MRLQASLPNLLPALLVLLCPAARAGDPPAAEQETPEFPPFSEIGKGYERIVSTADKEQPLWNVWRRSKDDQLLAELPQGFADKRFYIVPTVAGGDTHHE